MALAFLEYSGREGGALQFRLDLGSNRYFSWAVGDGQVAGAGQPRLDHPRFVSPVQGPLEQALLGRTLLAAPAGAFDRDHRFIQVVSYRTPSHDGPAVSEILPVPLLEVEGAGGDGVDPTLPRSEIMTPQTTTLAQRAGPTGVTRFRYRERPLDSAMFLDGLGSFLGTLLPDLSSALPALGDLGTAVARLLSGAGASPAPAAPPRASNPADVQQLLDLVTRIAQALKPPAPAGGGRAVAPAAAEALWVRAQGGGYSQAQIAPALMALMNPQTITAVTDSLAKLGALAIKNDESLRNWIKELNPGVDDAGLDSLLQGLAVEAAQPAQEVPYRSVARVKLQVALPSPLPLGGRPRALYRAGQDLGFRLSVDTPKPIAGATLLLSVKEPGTLRTLVKKGFKLERVGVGSLTPPPVVPRALLAPLAAGADYLLCVTLVWSGKDGTRLGATTAAPFTLAGAYAFDRVEEGGDVRPLNDVERHRDFWHKAWQATLDEQVRSYQLDCKYYYSLDPAAASNQRLETLVKTDAQGTWGQQGRLKSGLVASLPALNSLLAGLGQPALEPAQLDALRGEELAARFGRAARTKVSFRGRRGDSVALWIYPEVQLRKVVLQKVDAVDGLGAVTRLAEAAVVFPMPVSCHFIGASTQS